MSTQDRMMALGSRTMLALAALATAGLLAACGSSGAEEQSGTVQTSSAAVAVRAVDHPKLGRILVDATGRTLYFADQENDGTPRCLDDCLGFWLPAKSRDEKPIASGVSGVDVVHRSDSGATQLTYQGKPLYTFQLDKSSGDANGNDVADDFGDRHFTWHAVTLQGGQAPQNDGGGYGGGY